MKTILTSLVLALLASGLSLGADKALTIDQQKASIVARLNAIVIPSLDMEEAGLDEALEYLRVKSRDIARAKGGTAPNIILKLPAGEAAPTSKITLALKDIPLSEALRYVAELAGMKLRIEPHAVVVTSLSDDTKTLITKSYSVPPNFQSIGLK